MKQNVKLKKAISFLIVMGIVIGLLLVSAQAEVGNVDVGVEKLKLQYSFTEEKNIKQNKSHYTRSDTVNPLTFTVYSADGRINPQCKKGTLEITLTNEYDSEADLTADWTVSGYGSSDINGDTANKSGTINVRLKRHSNITIKIISAENTSGRDKGITLSISNMKLKEYVVDVSTTFLPPEHGGSYSVDNKSITEKITLPGKSNHVYQLTATPAAGYVFAGWKNADTNAYLSTEASWSTTFLKNTQILPVFVSEDSAQFGVGDQKFFDLNVANNHAASQSNKTIVLLKGGTLPKDAYTISAGVTLLIPYSDSTTINTTEPSVIESSPVQTVYRSLTIPSGAEINVYGSVCVNSQVLQNTSRPVGPYGLITLESKAAINLKDGANLYCWGYINGDGDVIAENGSTVYECFQLRGWRGGAASQDMIGKSGKYHVFVLNQFYIQNVEAALTFEYGATEKVFASVTVSNTQGKTTQPFIASIASNEGMFRLQNGCKFTKKYIAATDRIQFIVDGNLTISNIELNLSVRILGLYEIKVNLKSQEYALPIPNNFSVDIRSGITTIASNQDIALLPGARFTVSKEATFRANSNMYVYDRDQWIGDGTNNFAFGANFLPVYYSTINGTTKMRTDKDLVDATIDVNGKMEITGQLFTTTTDDYTGGGANIFSTQGTGEICFVSATTDRTSTYQATQNGNDITGYPEIKCNSAWLRNGDGTYTETAGAQAGWSYKYDTVQQRWYRFRVDYQFNGKNIGYDLITTDTATRDVRNYVNDGSSLVGTVTSGKADTPTISGGTLKVTGVGSDCTINIEGVAASYTPYFVLNEHQYSVYLSYGGTEITNKVTIDKKTYYVVESHGTMEFGAELSAPSADTMGVSDANHNSITWFLEDVTTGAQQFMNTVPSGKNKGEPVYIYGIYTGAVAHNSYTDKYYTNLKDAIVDLPVTGSATLTMYANCGTFEDESKTASYSLSANITFNVNGKEAWGSLVNNGTLTLDLNGGSVRYITGATAGSTSYRASAAVINNGTMTIQDSQGGGVISTDAVCDDNVRYDLKNHASAIRNLGSLAMESIRVSVDQSVNDWVTAVMNYNGGVITSMNDCSVVCKWGYGITNYGGTIQTISGGTINGGDAATAGRYGIQNRNMRSGSKTAESPYTIAKLGTIGTISGMNINVYQFGLDNYGTVNSISGGTSIAATKDAVYNRAGWYYDTQEIITITTESGNARTIVTTYDTQNYSTIKEISGNVSIAATGGDIGLRNYGNIGTIIGNVSISATGNYGLLNNGVINSISGSNVKIKANANALYNNENNRVLTQVEVRTNLGQIDKVTSGHYLTLREFERTYAAPHIGGIDGITIASTGGYGLYNQGTIDEVKNANVTSSANAVNNSNGYYTQRKCFTLAHGEKEFGTTSYIWEANISYTRNQPEINKLTGVTATTTSTTGALNNTGIINTIDGCTFTAQTHNALSNSLCVTGYYLGDRASAYEQYKAFISEGSSYVFRATDSTSEYTRGQIGSITNTKLSSTKITGEWAAVLDNTGYIGTIGAGTTINLNGASGTSATTKNRLYAIRVSDNCYATKRTVYKDVTNAIQSLGKPVSGNYYRQDDFSYTYTDGVRAEIGDISGVTISNNYGYGVWNCGKIGSVGQGTSISAYNHAVCNSSGSYTERSTVRLTTGTTLYSEGSCVGESTCSYKTIPAEITLIDGATIKTIGSDGGSYFGISNSGHIGTIKNTNIFAAYSSAIRNTGKTNQTYKVEYTGNGVSGISPYIVWDTSKTKYVFATTYSSTNSYSATCTPCVIDLIGEGNTLTSKNYTIFNSGIITEINGGTSKNTVSATGTSGVGINNYRGTNATEKVVAGSGTCTYNSATIGTIANTEVTAVSYSLLNGDTDGSYTAIAINELGAGNVFKSSSNACVYDRNYATIGKISGGSYTGTSGCVLIESNSKLNEITGGTFTATSTDTYALKNNNTSAAIAIGREPTFLGGTDSRSYAIYEADTTRQTYPEGGYTLSNKPNKDGYYYITENKITIWYHGNGSTSGEDFKEELQLPATGIVITANQPFGRKDWEFAGWARNANIGSSSDLLQKGDTVALSSLGNPGAGEEVHIYAIWQPKKAYFVKVSWSGDLVYTYQPNVYEWKAQKLCYELTKEAYWAGDYSVTVTNTDDNKEDGIVKVDIGYSKNRGYEGFDMNFVVGANTQKNAATLADKLARDESVTAKMQLIGPLPSGMVSGAKPTIGQVTLKLTAVG